MQINIPDPPYAEGSVVFGSAIDDHEFQGVLAHSRFKIMVPDPRRLEGSAARHHPDLADVADLRSRVQRLVTGAKKKNVEPYARYIIRKVKDGEGFTPQIVLWSERKLLSQVDEQTGFGWVVVPDDLKLVALDGDTQTTARHLAETLSREVFSDAKLKVRIKVAIVHGIPEDEAAQIFSDCNSRGVKVTTSMAIGLDNRDGATRLAKYVEKTVPGLTGLVNRQKRQLGKADKEVVTISALRTSVVYFEQGIGGVQNQTKSVDISEDELDRQRFAARVWYAAVVDALGTELAPAARENNFASAPAVWAAIGALGYDIRQQFEPNSQSLPAPEIELERRFKAEAKRLLGSIDWTRGDHWVAVGAKKSQTEAVTLGGPKESGSLVYKALKDGALVKGATAATAATQPAGRVEEMA